MPHNHTWAYGARKREAFQKQLMWVDQDGGGALASTPYAGTCGHGKWQYQTETTPHMGEIRRSSSKYALCDMDTVAMQSIVKRPEAMHSKVSTITFYQYLALPELATFFYMVLQGT